MSNCHDCKYHFFTSNPYERCLHFYGKHDAVSALKNGPSGKCALYAKETK